MNITIDVLKDFGVKKFYVSCENASKSEIFFNEKDVIDYVKFWL